MKHIAQLILIAATSSALSGCLFSQKLVQNAYDQKAEAECDTGAVNGDRYERPASSRCVDGVYYSTSKKRETYARPIER